MRKIFNKIILMFFIATLLYVLIEKKDTYNYLLSKIPSLEANLGNTGTDKEPIGINIEPTSNQILGDTEGEESEANARLKLNSVDMHNRIPHIQEKMLNYKFWTEGLDNSEEIIMTKNQIKDFNNKNIEYCSTLIDLKSYKEEISSEELLKLIKSISTLDNKVFYGTDGKTFLQGSISNLEEKLNLGKIQEKNQVRYGLSIRRSSIRTFPTHEPAYKKPGDIQFDRFMETAIYPCEPVLVLWESKDEKWFFVQMYNYLGWVPKSDIAIGDKKDIIDYVDRDTFVVVTGHQIYLNVKGEEITCDMGVVLPLTTDSNHQNSDKYTIEFPIKENGTLGFTKVDVFKNQEVTLGYLPYTRENIIKQAFKFLGEQYGWGGMNNARDCSAFIMDIYRTFGINLPRNTGDQGQRSYGETYDLSKYNNIEGKKEALTRLDTPIPLYMSGHTMLYIGEYQGRHYIIHNFAGFYDIKSDGTKEYIDIMGVALTTLDINLSNGKTFLEAIYNGRNFVDTVLLGN